MTLIRSLLIGTFCLGSLATITNAARPAEVPRSILREGCVPFGGLQCPAKMECYVDLSYPKYGMCACRPDFMFTRKPPANTGLELAPPPHKDDCITMGPIATLTFLHFMIPTLLYVYMIVVGIGMMKSIYQGGGLKFNSSCVALFANIMGNIGGASKNVFFAVSRANWDKHWHVFDYSFPISDAIETAFTLLMVFECACTWFDLWQKSVTMSKKSNALVSVVRNFFRIYSTAYTIVFVLARFGAVEGLTETTLGGLLTVNQYFQVLSCGILSPLIGRILCKNMKEVTNPNWKAASAIQTTGLNGVFVPIAFDMAYRFFLWSGLFLNQAIQMNCLTIFTFSTLHMFYMFSWFQYLQFAHRRYLKDAHTSRISEYFGFTTLGLNGSRRESSFLSGKTTNASSAASAASAASGASTTSSIGGASSASTAEGEATTDGKGTMA